MCMTINNYRKYSLDGIRNNRMNAGRKPVISTHKNKEMVRNSTKSPKTFGYLYMEYQAVDCYLSLISTLLEMNVSPMQTNMDGE
jgi:hypothetical protein